MILTSSAAVPDSLMASSTSSFVSPVTSHMQVEKGTEIGYFRAAFHLCVETILHVQNFPYENVFCLQVHLHANQTHFHMTGFA